MANTRIPELAPALGLDGTEEIELAVGTGSPVSYVSRRGTTGQIAALVTAGGGILIVTGNAPVVVPANIGTLVFDKAIAGASSVTLGPTLARGGKPLYIFDFSGNSGNITITPDASDVGGIMGLASFTILSGGSLLLVPIPPIFGWGAMA